MADCQARQVKCLLFDI